MRNGRRRRVFDIVMMSDLRLVGGSTLSIAEEIKAQRRAGYTTAVVQVPTDIISGDRAIDPAIRRCIVDGLAELVLLDERVRARAVICRLPAAFRQPPPMRLDVIADVYVMVANQAPLEPSRTRAHYRVADVVETTAHLFGDEVLWAPIGPSVRSLLAEHDLPLRAEDWVNVLDVDRYPADRTTPCDDRPVIGRHSRPQWQKWPDNAADISDAYPADPGLRVRILGGAEVPRQILGALPGNWEVWPYGGLPVPEFLRRIDFFVYYHHPLWVEAFGRAIIEAMASGAVPILPPHFEALFGPGCRYAAPAAVVETVMELYGDWHHYRDLSDAAVRSARNRFGHEAHVRRLVEAIGPPMDRAATRPSTSVSPAAKAGSA